MMDDRWVQEIQRFKTRYQTDPVNAAWYLVGNKDPYKPALYYYRPDHSLMTYSYGALREESAKWAARLAAQGVRSKDRVAGLLPKRSELAAAILGAWRLGAVYVPLFTAFGSEAVRYRIEQSRAKVVITDDTQLEKVAGIGDVSVFNVDHPDQAPESLDVWQALSENDLLVLLFTSGTTGHPKGVPVPMRALPAFEAYMRWGLDVRPSDRFWNLADPGWAYGLYYGLIGPWLVDQPIFWYGGPFDADRVMALIQEAGITNFAAAPTAYRAMRAQGAVLPATLRAISSAGEPLNPEVIQWAEAALGLPILDHYGQTELGMVINNHQVPELQRPLKRGAMGHPMPGFRAVVLDDEGQEVPPKTEGHIAIDMGHSPLFWFPGYEGADSATSSRFTADGRYYLTGDDGSVDDEGYFFFTGRSDDVILSAGYRIGPFEVESSLMAHPAVAECAVVGVPDALRGEAVRAYVVLRPGFVPNAPLEDELKDWVRQRLAKTHYPREIRLVDSLPKTPSGKIQRFLLRQSE